MKTLAYLLFILAITFAGCKKDDDNSPSQAGGNCSADDSPIYAKVNGVCSYSIGIGHGYQPELVGVADTNFLFYGTLNGDNNVDFQVTVHWHAPNDNFGTGTFNSAANGERVLELDNLAPGNCKLYRSKVNSAQVIVDFWQVDNDGDIHTTGKFNGFVFNTCNPLDSIKVTDGHFTTE